MSVIGFDMETSSEDLIMETHRHIIRGKRTKRSRPSVVTSSSSGGYSFENDACFSIVSPQSCENSVSTEEDEAMANCLILLAQSGNSFNSKQHHEEEIHTKNLITTSKFTEMANSTTEKAGFYVYECKTCNRNFPSFQALGGHRASHKRPKTEEKKLPITTILHENNEDQELTQFKKTSISISPQKAKVHECSICGSEFSSGQALGGHMRRHRIPTTNTSTTINSRIEQEDQKPRNVLQLDLNLPAPEDHDHYESKFQFVFSGPPLVGCHY